MSSVQNIYEQIFTTSYTYTTASGFQAQVNTQLYGDLHVGNLDTSFSVLFNGLSISEVVGEIIPYNWSLQPAISDVNLSGNFLINPGGSINVCGDFVSTGGITTVGNITSIDGNIVTLSGNIVAGNIAAAYEMSIGGNTTIGGTLNVTGGIHYNTSVGTIDNNGGGITFTGSNYFGINYLGYLTPSDTDNVLFLSIPSTSTSPLGSSVKMLQTAGSNTQIVSYTSPTSTSVIATVSDTILHEFVYFGPSPGWVQIY